MIELTGKYGSAKVFTDLVDNESISQIINLLNQPFSDKNSIRMMPDVHAGAGCTIGTTMTISDKICPNLVGVDIGCGMYAVRLREKEIDLSVLDDTIRKFVPSGFAIHDEPLPAAEQCRVQELHCLSAVNIPRALNSIGSLGGGNHFIEVDRDSNGNLWLVIHSGCRHLGIEVAGYYQKEAIKVLHAVPKDEINQTVAKLKAEGRQTEIPDAIKALQPPYKSVPEDLCFCEGKLFEDYIHDMKIAQEYAMINRLAIAKTIENKMGFAIPAETFTTVHNYIDTKAMILRKGAVSAKKGERLIIPMNMRDGSLLCVGKGNPDWNYSAPHGAGRLMSRSEAKQNVDMEEFRKSMEGIWTTSVNISTIDESPMAYKPMESILDNIGDTVDIVDILKPIYNFKAGE